MKQTEMGDHGMNGIIRRALPALLLCALLAVPALAENQYYAVHEPIEISAAQTVTLTLDAQEGWMWNIADNTDEVTKEIIEEYHHLIN